MFSVCKKTKKTNPEVKLMNVGAADSLSADVCLIKMIHCYDAWFCQGGSAVD